MFITRAICGLTYIRVAALRTISSLQKYIERWPAALNEAGRSESVVMKRPTINDSRTPYHTFHLHYPLFMRNKLQYTWPGDYCERVQPNQLLDLTWDSSSVPPGKTSTIRSPSGQRRIQQYDQKYVLVFM